MQEINLDFIFELGILKANLESLLKHKNLDSIEKSIEQLTKIQNHENFNILDEDIITTIKNLIESLKKETNIYSITNLINRLDYFVANLHVVTEEEKKEYIDTLKKKLKESVYEHSKLIEG